MTQPIKEHMDTIHRYEAEWQQVAEDQDLAIEHYDDLVVFYDEQSYPTVETVVGMAHAPSYKRIREETDLDSFNMPSDRTDIHGHVTRPIHQVAGLLPGITVPPVDPRACTADAVSDEVGELFYEGTTPDLAFIGEGHESSVFQVEDSDVAVEKLHRYEPYAIKEFINLYTANLALNEIKDILSSPVDAPTPLFATPSFLFQEYVHRLIPEVARGDTMVDLDDAGYKEVYDDIAAEILDEIDLPMALERTYLRHRNFVAGDDALYHVDPADWRSLL